MISKTIISVLRRSNQFNYRTLWIHCNALRLLTSDSGKRGSRRWCFSTANLVVENTMFPDWVDFERRNGRNRNDEHAEFRNEQLDPYDDEWAKAADRETSSHVCVVYVFLR